MTRYKAIVHASELLTGEGVRKKNGRRVGEADLGSIPDGALVYSVRKAGSQEIPHRIEWAGPTAELPKKWRSVSKLDLKQKKAVTPGFVDCHNHLLFAGD